MKATFKNVAAALSVLAVIMVGLITVDGLAVANVSAGTALRVCVVDLNNNPVHNAQVTVNGATFYTDNKGLSPAIDIKNLTNCYDSAITEWGTVSVTVKCDGYVPSLVFNAVVYNAQTRKLTVKAYPRDDSDLPYTIFVESPPDSYVKGLLNVK